MKLSALLFVAISIPAFAAPSDPDPSHKADLLPVQLENACVNKIRPTLGRTQIVDIKVVNGVRDKDVILNMVDYEGNRSTKLCQVQQDGSLLIN